MFSLIASLLVGWSVGGAAHSALPERLTVQTDLGLVHQKARWETTDLRLIDAIEHAVRHLAPVRPGARYHCPPRPIGGVTAILWRGPHSSLRIDEGKPCGFVTLNGKKQLYMDTDNLWEAIFATRSHTH